MTIGERIKQRRLELGLTVDELAQRLEKNRATIYRYESNDIENLPTTVLEPLAKELDTTPAYLMGWEEEHINRLKKRRIELNLSTREVANYMNVTLQTIVRWESGHMNTLLCNKENVILLADILHVSPFYILGVDISPDIVDDSIMLDFYLDSNNKKLVIYSSDEISLIGKYRALNDIGKKKVRENIDDIGKIYASSNKAYLEPKAAHERTDIEVTEEMRQHDDGIMNDDDFWK